MTNRNFYPVDSNPDEIYSTPEFVKKDDDVFGAKEAVIHEVPHFSVHDEFVQLSPEEAWAVKHYLTGVNQDSDYGELRAFLNSHFLSSVYETTPSIKVPHDSGVVLAGAYTGIYWELMREDLEKAEAVKQRIEAIIEHQPEEVQEFFRSQFIGPSDHPTNN